MTTTLRAPESPLPATMEDFYGTKTSSADLTATLSHRVSTDPRFGARDGI